MISKGSNPDSHIIIACGSLRHEFELVIGNNPAPAIHYLDTDLHRTPARIPGILQAKINELQKAHETILLGYGLCSNGVVGVSATSATLIIPRVHDCLDLFLGFVGWKKSRIDSLAMQYYLTPGTILNHKDPLAIMEREYTPKMGQEMSHWGMKEELKHYNRFALITTDRPDMKSIKAQALRNAHFFETTLVEIESDLKFFKKIIYGPHDTDSFLHLPPGNKVTQEMFF